MAESKLVQLNFEKVASYSVYVLTMLSLGRIMIPLHAFTSRYDYTLLGHIVFTPTVFLYDSYIL